jgi:cytochrome c oxidase subunit 4
MADAHDTVTGSHGPEAHAGPTFNVYIGVFVALAFFTLMSFLVNAIFHGELVYAGVAIILGVAVVKAVLVSMYFMHLKFDWAKLYFIVVPLLILTVMMVIVLLPDTVVNAHKHPDDQIGLPAPPEHVERSH